MTVDAPAIPKIITTLYQALVVSIATAKLPLVLLTKLQRKKFQKLQINFAAEVVGIQPPDVHKLLLAELQWEPIGMFIMKAKFLLAGRIFRAQKAQDPNTYFMAKKRIAQVEAGDENGLLAEIFRKIRKDPDSPLWYKNAKNQKKNEFKNKVKKFLKTQCEKKFSLFLNESQKSRSVRNYKKLFQK